MIVREGALCRMGNTLSNTHTQTHTPLVEKPITAGLKFFFMNGAGEANPWRLSQGCWMKSTTKHRQQAFSQLPRHSDLHAIYMLWHQFPCKCTWAGLVSAECCYKSGGREKGMSRSGAGGVEHGGDHWPSGRSPGVFPLQDVASAFSAVHHSKEPRRLCTAPVTNASWGLIVPGISLTLGNQIEPDTAPDHLFTLATTNPVAKIPTPSKLKQKYNKHLHGI